jgi:hypothetical protein
MRRLDLRGKRFGKWTVRNQDPVIRSGATYWECDCDCGEVRLVNGKDLNRGYSLDCGCGRTKKLNEFSYLHGMSKHPLHAKWRVIMDRCYNPKNTKYYLYGGKGIIVWGPWHSFKRFYEDIGEKPGPDFKLIRFDTNGPYSYENYGWTDKHQCRKHGHAGEGNGTTAIYKAWRSMRARCNYPKHASYEFYGARGIKYCDRWKDYVNFLVDMGSTWFPGAELDRIDFDGDYSPENCQWIKRGFGLTRNSVIIEFKGEKVTRAEACRRLNLEYAVVSRLMNRKHLSFDEAVAQLRAAAK